MGSTKSEKGVGFVLMLTGFWEEPEEEVTVPVDPGASPDLRDRVNEDPAVTVG